jgi:hypothetical protein
MAEEGRPELTENPTEGGGWGGGCDEGGPGASTFQRVRTARGPRRDGEEVRVDGDGVVWCCDEDDRVCGRRLMESCPQQQLLLDLFFASWLFRKETLDRSDSSHSHSHRNPHTTHDLTNAPGPLPCAAIRPTAAIATVAPPPPLQSRRRRGAANSAALAAPAPGGSRAGGTLCVCVSVCVCVERLAKTCAIDIPARARARSKSARSVTPNLKSLAPINHTTAVVNGPGRRARGRCLRARAPGRRLARAPHRAAR